MKAIQFLFLIFISFAQSELLYADGFSAEVDHTIVELGESIMLNLRVEGDPDADPQVPQIPGVVTQYVGPQSQISIINGKTSKSVTYMFALQPEKVGEFKIPSMTVKISGTVFTSLSINIKVVGAGQNNQGEGAPPVFVERTFSKDSAWVGEPIVSKIKVYHRIALRQPQVDPATPSLVKRIPVPGQKEDEALVKGTRYQVIEISEVLIPLKSGKITFDPYSITGLFSIESKQRGRRQNTPFDMFDNFFDDPFSRGRMVRKTFSTNSWELTVKELPAQPKGFSGLVGEYELSADLSQTDVNAGDTSTLTLTLNGYGNLEGSRIFENLDIVGTKIYPDKPEINVNATMNQGLVSKGVYKFAIVPSQAGDLDLGSLSLNVFNSKTGQYEDLTVGLGRLSVKGGTTNNLVTEFGDTKRRVQSLGSDLIGIHRGTKLLEDQELRWSTVFYSAAVCTVPLFLGFYGWWRRRFQFNKEFLAQKKRSKAFQLAKKSLFTDSDLNIEEQVKQTVAAIRVYFSMKIGNKAEAMTVNDIKKIVQDKKIADVDIEPLIKVFELYNLIEYGRLNAEHISMQEIKNLVLDVLKKMEGKL